MKTELTTIDPELLANTCGGDYASKWWKQLKQDYTDGRNRGNTATHDLLKGDVGGATKNFVASQLDGVAMIGDAVSPAAAIVGAKP